MRDDAALERRLLSEGKESRIASIDKGGPDAAKVEITYGWEGEHIGDDIIHGGHFIIGCHRLEEWDEEERGEPYSPYASSEAIIEEWFKTHPDFCDFWEIDDTYAA